jgi:hypothetical protein
MNRFTIQLETLDGCCLECPGVNPNPALVASESDGGPPGRCGNNDAVGVAAQQSQRPVLADLVDIDLKNELQPNSPVKQEMMKLLED